MAGKWIKKYLSGNIDPDEKANYEQIKRAVEAGVSMDYETFISQNVTFQEIWRDIHQAKLSENISSFLMALGLEDRAKEILNFTYCKDEGQAILQGGL